MKCPLDLWVYQEIICTLRPDVIVECGTYRGGGALFLASICDLVNHGRIITIDTKRWSDVMPRHKRIEYLIGSSTSDVVVRQVEKAARAKKTLVILDSDHSKENVLAELRSYSRFVSVGSYLIVEDTNINGHPVRPDFGPGPWEAVKEFLQENNNFAVDSSKERFFLTMNPGGYLKRIS